MTEQQQRALAAIRARLRHGFPVELALEQCLQAGIAVRVVRHHFGRQMDPQFGRVQDVSAEYGVVEKGNSHADLPASRSESY